MTPELQVMDFQVLRATATLTLPPIAHQDLTVQRAIAVRMQPAASVVSVGSFQLTLASTQDTNASCCGRDKELEVARERLQQGVWVGTV